jgi:hypothetical protein
MCGSPWLRIPPDKQEKPCSVVANPPKPRCKHRGFAFMEIPVAFAPNYFIMKFNATVIKKAFLLAVLNKSCSVTFRKQLFHIQRIFWRETR